ncbi:MAG TPA: hypothetical protein VET88_04730, partial [Gammaproteobacteria bacterium]|nr:hypothetical protein [Gammaproteobacteria bacterium]
MPRPALAAVLSIYSRTPPAAPCERSASVSCCVVSWVWVATLFLRLDAVIGAYRQGRNRQDGPPGFP